MNNLEKYTAVLSTVFKMLERAGRLTPDIRDSYTELLTTAHALDLMEEKLEQKVLTFVELAKRADEDNEED